MLLFFKISSCGSRKSILKKNLGSRSVVAAVATRKFEQINFKNKKAIDENRSNNAQSRTPMFNGYCTTVQGLLDWFEVDLGFTELSMIQGFFAEMQGSFAQM